jgi:hypothetical protein
MAVTRFQFRGRLGQRVEGDAVENGGERIGLVAKRSRRRGEDPRAGGAAPELHRLKLLGARALADKLDAAAMRTALGPLRGVGNTGGGRTPGMRLRRMDRSRRAAGAAGGITSRIPEGRHVTDTGKAACHAFREMEAGKGRRDSGLAWPVGGRAECAARGACQVKKRLGMGGVTLLPSGDPVVVILRALSGSEGPAAGAGR